MIYVAYLIEQNALYAIISPTNINQSCPGNGQVSWAKKYFICYLPAATSVTELSARAESSALAT